MFYSDYFSVPSRSEKSVGYCIAKELGLTPSTLNTIIAKRSEIEENTRNLAGGCKQARGSEHAQLDEAIFKRFKQVRAAGVNFNGTIL